MSKIIIGIHGMGNKPEQEQLQKWWKKAIKEGLSGVLGLGFFRFKLVYWASVLHAQPLQKNEQDEDSPLYLKEPYSKKLSAPEELPRRTPFRIKLRKHINDQLDRILLEEDGSLNFSMLTDFILQKFFHDVDAYYNNSADNSDRTMPREAICRLLSKTLKKYRNRDIMLIAHSMGTIIAWDVLTRYVPDIKIDTFVTIGSPLGIPIVKSKILKETPPSEREKLQLKTPENIVSKWYNLSDFEDRVALSYDLREDFLVNSRGVLPQDVFVENNYQYKGEPNPHKSYGYLRCREMAEIISGFLKRPLYSIFE